MIFTARPRHPVTGGRIRLRARSRRELDAYRHRLDELRTQLRLGTATPDEVSRELRHLRFGPITLERACRAYLDRPLAPNTKAGLRSLMATHLRPLLALPLAGVDAARVSALLDAMRAAGDGETTIATAWRRLSAVVAHASERGWIGEAPWGAYRPRIGATATREPREAARTVDELVRLIVAAAALADADPRRPVRLDALIGVLAFFGLRQGEAGGLRWGDWDARALSLLVARQFDGAPLKRGTRTRRLGTVPEVAELFALQRARLEALELYDSAGPIFPHAPSSQPNAPRHYTRGQLLTSRDLRSAVRRAELPHVGAWSAHSLRDTFVTLEAAALGGDLRALQERSRHATLSSLARYLRALTRVPTAPAFRRQAFAAAVGPPLLGRHAPPPPKNEPP